jgi:uncharacterized protein (TIGR04255 family)
MTKWKNAPVAYVIVQARFSPILSLETYIPQIQEQFRTNGFPAFAPRMNFQLGFNLPIPSEASASVANVPFQKTMGYVFTDREKSKSFVLEQNSLTLHVTDYVDFGWFLNLFMKHLAYVVDIVKPDSSDRIGLRFIDIAAPGEGIEIHKYLVPEVTGLSKKMQERSELHHAFTETMLQKGKTLTVSRVLIREGDIAFPPDLQSLPVALSPRFVEYRGVHALIDTDSFQMESAEMDAANIREVLQELHGSVEHAFKNVVTEFALAEWT